MSLTTALELSFGCFCCLIFTHMKVTRIATMSIKMITVATTTDTIITIIKLGSESGLVES